VQPGAAARQEAALKTPQDLRHHVLLHDDYSPREPWLDWDTWLQAHGVTGLDRAVGRRLFSHYDQMIQAAVTGRVSRSAGWPLLSGFDRAPSTRRRSSRRRSKASRRADAAFFVFCEPRAPRGRRKASSTG